LPIVEPSFVEDLDEAQALKTTIIRNAETVRFMARRLAQAPGGP
jgi:hypothetical protein